MTIAIKLKLFKYNASEILYLYIGIYIVLKNFPLYKLKKIINVFEVQ